jgi:hypothetical protein
VSWRVVIRTPGITVLSNLNCISFVVNFLWNAEEEEEEVVNQHFYACNTKIKHAGIINGLMFQYQ